MFQILSQSFFPYGLKGFWELGEEKGTFGEEDGVLCWICLKIFIDSMVP